MGRFFKRAVKVVAVVAAVIFALVVVNDIISGLAHWGEDKYIEEEEYDEDEEDEVVMVYISTSPRAQVYHIDPDCRWLRQTEHEIQVVSIEYAEAKGRRPCKGCSVE